jgi:hypothetical protein
MSTKRETLLAAVKSSLTGVTGVQDANVFRSRTAAFGKQAVPAIVIEPLSDRAQRPAIGRLQWEMVFQVFVIVRDDDPDQTADEIINSIHAKIMGSASIDSQVVDLLPVSTDWQLVDADTPLGVITMQFQATYQTAANDLSS